MMKDYYSILGVSRTSGSVEIKRVYRKLAVQYHPDKNPDPSVGELFKEINEAYETLSDPKKKAVYDQRLDNPFAQLIEEPPVPRHRDPAYRRPRRSPPPGNNTNALQELMGHYLKYVIWFSRTGLILTSLFFIDYILPFETRDEKITLIRPVRLKSGIAYYKVFTSTGEKIKVYPSGDIVILDEETTVRVSYTLLYDTPMSIAGSAGSKIRLGYFYYGQIFLPLSLFLASLFSVILRTRVDLSFNLAILSALLLIINFVFI
jgi:hypothetical protein